MNQKSTKFKHGNKDMGQEEDRKLRVGKPIDEKLLKEREKKIVDKVVRLYDKLWGRSKLTNKMLIVEKLRRTNTLIAREALKDVRLSDCDVYLKEWARKSIVELDKVLKENAMKKDAEKDGGRKEGNRKEGRNRRG